MKIRQGFVSNSSSSSFVILLPKEFGKEDFKKLFDAANCQNKLDENDIDYDYVEKAVSELLHTRSIWSEDYYEALDILETVFINHMIATFDTGPDSGQIVVADADVVKKILGITQ